MADFPDYHFPIILKGQYGTDLKILSVDESGRLIAALKAVHGVTAKDVQCDTNGNLTLNLKAQDLSEIINRPKYGAAQGIDSSVAIGAGNVVQITAISGKGIIYGGAVYFSSTATHSTDLIWIVVDGNTLPIVALSNLDLYNFDKEHRQSVYKTKYDNTNFIYGVGFMPGITFESSFIFYVYNFSAVTTTYYMDIVYALV